MLYVLTLGWEWFAAAGVLGMLIGFVTATHGREGQVSGRWIVLLASIALAGAGVVATMGLAPARAGLWLEIALLTCLAYFFGLPLGGGAKGLLPIPASVRAPPKQPPVILRGAPREKEAVTPATQPIEELLLTPKADQAEPPPAKPAPKKDFPGQRPDELAQPRGGSPDKLGKIKGIGPKSLEKLHALGIFHYDQIAAWNIDNARWIGAALAAPGASSAENGYSRRER